VVGVRSPLNLQFNFEVINQLIRDAAGLADRKDYDAVPLEAGPDHAPCTVNQAVDGKVCAFEGLASLVALNVLGGHFDFDDVQVSNR
jgi:hypothetical protein